MDRYEALVFCLILWAVPLLAGHLIMFIIEKIDEKKEKKLKKTLDKQKNL